MVTAPSVIARIRPSRRHVTDPGREPHAASPRGAEELTGVVQIYLN